MTDQPACLPIGGHLLPLPAELDRLARAHPDDAVPTRVARYLVGAAGAASCHGQQLRQPRAWLGAVVRRRVSAVLADPLASGAVRDTMAEQLAVWVDRDLLDDRTRMGADLTAVLASGPPEAAAGLALVLGHPVHHPGEAACAVHAPWRAGTGRRCAI